MTTSSSSTAPLVEASIVLFCGIPGSGKSQLASIISNYYSPAEEETKQTNKSGIEQNTTVKSTFSPNSSKTCFDNVVYIEYDAITSSISDQMLVMTKDYNQPKTRQPEHYEEGEYIGLHNNNYTSIDLEAWRQTRKEALKILHDELTMSILKARNEIHGTDSDKSSSQSCSKKILILMDDNFHLRSMRRDVYKACQKFLSARTFSVENDDKLSSSSVSFQKIVIGLTIVHVNTPLSTCLIQNELRKNTKRYIPKETIIKMDLTLEEPDFQKAKFESCTIKTKTAVTSEAQDKTTSIAVFLDELDQCMQQSINDYPILIPHPMKTPEERREEQKKTLQSRLHRQDLVLRTLVGVTCRADSSLAQVANKTRKSTLEKLKNQDYGDHNCDYNDDVWVLRQFEKILNLTDKSTTKIVGKDSKCSIAIRNTIREAHAKFLCDHKELSDNFQ